MRRAKVRKELPGGEPQLRVVRSILEPPQEDLARLQVVLQPRSLGREHQQGVGEAVGIAKGRIERVDGVEVLPDELEAPLLLEVKAVGYEHVRIDRVGEG